MFPNLKEDKKKNNLKSGTSSRFKFKMKLILTFIILLMLNAPSI